MWLVIARFAPYRFELPSVTRLTTSLDLALAVAPTGGGQRLANDVDAHLSQDVWRRDGEEVEARYAFDARYAEAHPESLDPAHLALWHGTIAAKLHDDGAIVLGDESIVASLHWRSVRTKSRPLRPRRRAPES